MDNVSADFAEEDNDEIKSTVDPLRTLSSFQTSCLTRNASETSHNSPSGSDNQPSCVISFENQSTNVQESLTSSTSMNPHVNTAHSCEEKVCAMSASSIEEQWTSDGSVHTQVLEGCLGQGEARKINGDGSQREGVQMETSVRSDSDSGICESSENGGSGGIGDSQETPTQGTSQGGVDQGTSQPNGTADSQQAPSQSSQGTGQGGGDQGKSLAEEEGTSEVNIGQEKKVIIHRSVSCCKVGTEDLVYTGRDHLHLYFVLFSFQSLCWTIGIFVKFL